MADEFEQLWAVYSFYPDFPDELPAKRRYELMRDYLDHPSASIGLVAGNTILNFAIMSPKTVPLTLSSVAAKILLMMKQK